MELAIPLVALGGMYVISNQTSQNNTSTHRPNPKKVSFQEPVKESFETAGRYRNYLPNVEIPPENFPVTNRKELVNTVQEYVNPNTATDRYFDQNAYENRSNAGKSTGNNPQQIYSLTGNYLDSQQFKHNNMVPFYGGKIKGYTL